MDPFIKPFIPLFVLCPLVYVLAFIVSHIRHQSATFYWILLAIQVIISFVVIWNARNIQSDAMGSAIAEGYSFLFLLIINTIIILTLITVFFYSVGGWKGVMVALSVSAALMWTVHAIDFERLHRWIFNITVYELYPGGNAPTLYPTTLHRGNFILEGGKNLPLPQPFSFADTWGGLAETDIRETRSRAPEYIDITWFSLAENQFYSLKSALPKERIERLLSEKNDRFEQNEQKYKYIVAGMAPYGGLAVWLAGFGITTEVAWLQAEPVDMEWDFFWHSNGYNREEFINSYFKDDRKKAYENFQKNGLPDRMLYERYMQKFNYRITPKFENEKAIFEEIELYYYNGELNKTNSGEHTENAMRAKPRKIVIEWKEADDRYSLYIWPNEKNALKVFDIIFETVEEQGELSISVSGTQRGYSVDLTLSAGQTSEQFEEYELILFKNGQSFLCNEFYKRPAGGWRD